MRCAWRVLTAEKGAFDGVGIKEVGRFWRLGCRCDEAILAGIFGRRRNVGVSNPAQSALKLRGVAPRAKVSLTRIRPAQHGHTFSGAVASK